MAKTETNNVWKKGKAGQDLTCPSGQKCRAKRVDLKVFLKAGKVPNSMRKIIDKAMSGKDFTDEEVVQEMMSGEGNQSLNDMIAMVDTVCLDCVLEPRLHPIPYTEDLDEDGDPLPVPFADRDQDTIYVDEVDLEDRMFIFNWAVGGSADVDNFRERSTANLELVHTVAGDGSSAE